jgi:hypothetical protein
MKQEIIYEAIAKYWVKTIWVFDQSVGMVQKKKKKATFEIHFESKAHRF